MPEAFEFPAGVTAQHRIILENLVRTFQVTMREGDNWVAQESNASGDYEAAYRRTSPLLVEKIKRNFVGRPSAPTYMGAEIASTETFRTLARRDWIAAMTVDEIVRTKGQGGPALEITNHATLELRPVAKAAAGPDTWAFVAAAAEPTEHEVPSLSREQAHRQIIAEVATLDVALEGRTTRIHRLRDLLRVDGALPAELLELMKTEQLTDRTRADLYLAFELAGTEEAQAALTSVIGDPAWSLPDSMRAIVALGGVAHPSPDTRAALWVTAQSAPSTDDGRLLASTATFALGSLGQTMNAAGDPDYSSLSARLLNGAVGAADTQQRANFVHALGNTRDASLAQNVVALLDDPAPEVRRAAALSLGMLDPNQVAGDLMSHFEQESNNEVRGAIAESLVNWTEPTAPAVAAIRAGVRTEFDENTRYNMARFLGANLENYPESRPVLQDLLRTEQSRRIRQSVAEALAASG
jgi:HEAT repeat protein